MANVITGFRIVCAVILIFCPVFSIWFYILYISGGISDILDGAVARHFGKETKFGAQFDTIADIFFAGVIIIKSLRAIHLPITLIIWIICIAVIRCISILIGFILYKRFVPEHTVMNKICGILLFAIPLCIGLLPPKPVTALIVFTCAVASFAALQEGYFICIGKNMDPAEDIPKNHHNSL